MVDILKKENATYMAQKNILIGTSREKFVLIKDEKILDVFDAKIDAIRQGYERLGNVPFFVKQVVEIETPQNFTSNLLGK